MAAHKQSAHSQEHYRLSEAHRHKIQNSNILSYLIEHAQGERPMTQTQVTASIALLKKVLPDLQSVDMTAFMAVTTAKMTKEQRDAVAAAFKRADD